MIFWRCPRYDKSWVKRGLVILRDFIGHFLSASFLTPYYDITFIINAESWKRWQKKDAYADLCQLPSNTDENVLFLGGKDYLPLFMRLTALVRSKRTVFCNSSTQPDAPGCELERFVTTTRTNWHYECADMLLRDKLARH
jgi:hypothetical protein